MRLMGCRHVSLAVPILVILAMVGQGLCEPLWGQGWEPGPPVLRLSSLTTEDGLSHNTVYGLAQDAQGYLWLATEDGLNRYDGYGFKVFRHEPENPESLAHNDVNFLLADNQGFLWIATWGGGLDRFDPRTESFTHYSKDSENPRGLPDDQLLCLFIDRSERMWIGTFNQGLVLFDRKSGVFTTFRHDSEDPASLSHDRVWDLAEDRDGTLWIATEQGLNARRTGWEGFIRYHHDPRNPSSLSHDLVRALETTADGTVWVGTEAGLDRYTPVTDDFERVEALRGATIHALHHDDRGTLWIGTNSNGLHRFEVATGQVESVTVDAETLPAIRALFEDRSEILWVGTKGGGVAKLDLKPAKFFSLTHHPQDPDGLIDGRVRTVAEDAQGRLWVGTEKGLDRFDAAGVTHFQPRPGDPSSLPGDEINDLLVDSEGRLWVSVWRGGLSRFVGDEEGFVNLLARSDDPLGLPTDHVTALLEDRDGDLWIGSDEGLLRLDPRTRSFETFRHDPDDPGSLSHDTISAVYEDRAGQLWVGTSRGGLNRFVRADGGFDHWRHDPRDPRSLSDDRVYSLGEDGMGSLWIGTARGLDELLPSGELRRHAGSGVLPEARYFGVLTDDDDHLWLSTHNGLWELDPRQGEARRYTLSDGLQGDEFRPGAYGKGRDGRLYFGGQNGLDTVDPRTIRDNPYPPKLALNAVRGFDGEALELPVPASQLRLLELDHDQNFLSLELAALEFTSPEENRYRYMLEGHDADWVDAGSKRFAAYSHLDPGRYRFHARAANSDGLWSERELSIELVIEPPFWQTWWWRLSWALGLLAAFSGIHRWRVRRLESREEELQQGLEAGLAELRKSEERLRRSQKLESLGVLAGGIAHDFNNLLVGILGNAQIARHGLDPDSPLMAPLQGIEKAAERASLLANQMLAYSGKAPFRVQRIDLSRVAEEVSRLLVLRDVEVCFELAEALPLIEADAVQIDQVVMNLTTNAAEAVTGCENGKITLKTGVMDCGEEELASTLLDDPLEPGRYVYFEVRDNGCGMDEETVARIFDPFFTTKLTGRGLGLAAVLGIVRSHRGAIELRSTPGAGTRFRVLFPVAPPGDEAPITETATMGEDWRGHGTVLIIDDEEMVREVVSDMVQALGFETILAEDGLEGVKIYRQRGSEIDLVLLDLTMPQMSGEEVLFVLRQIDSDVKVVLASGYAELEDHERLSELGFSGFIQKPYRMSVLRDTLRQALEA